MRILFSIFLILFITCGRAGAVTPVVLTPEIQDFVLNGNHYEIFEDTSASLTINDVATKYSNRFFKSKEEYDYIKDPAVAYWLRFSIKEDSSIDRKWVLEFLSLHTQDIQFYVPQSDGSFKMSRTGQNFPFVQREYEVSNLVFDLPGKLQGQTFYVRIYSKHVVGFEFKVRTQNYFTSYAVSEYYFLGLYYGILLIMAIYNFLLFLTSGGRTYLYYVFYVFSCMLISFTEDGFGFQFVWHNYPTLNWVINNFLWPILFISTFIAYSTSFLELRKNHPKFFRIILYLTLFYFGVFGLELLFHDYVNASYVYVLPFIAVYLAGVYVYRNGYKAARYFILGFTFVFISIVILQLRNFNLIDHTIFTVYSFNFGILMEVVVLSIALGDKIKVMKEDKEDAQRVLIHQLEENQKLQVKVNKELEDKVTERTQQLTEKTKELSEANDKLKQLTDELNKFASKLDLDNWELNKKIVEETRARMLSKELSTEEFSKIFPNEFSCLKYLEEVKWGEGYKCKKCGNAKFAVKPKLLSRKCSKCNYIESVTSSTIFHGIKFPLHKAFYIAYITSAKSDKITVDELAENLQLNRLTCWKFRKKVMEREGEIRKKSQVSKVDNWEILLREF